VGAWRCCGDISHIRFLSCFPKQYIKLTSPQVLLVLVRIEPYFLIAFVVTYGLINVHFAEPEFGLTMALPPALLIQVAMTIVFTKCENSIGAIAAIVSSTSSSGMSR
jgi:hypothetical protein